MDFAPEIERHGKPFNNLFIYVCGFLVKFISKYNMVSIICRHPSNRGDEIPAAAFAIEKCRLFATAGMDKYFHCIQSTFFQTYFNVRLL